MGEAREVGNHKDALILVATDQSQNLSVLWIEELEGSAAKGLIPLPQGDEALHPPEKRIRVVLLGLHIDGLVVILWIDDDGEIETLGIGMRKTRIPVSTPVHGGPDAVPVAQVDIVPHPDLVPIEENGRTGQGEKKTVQDLDPSTVIA